MTRVASREIRALQPGLREVGSRWRRSSPRCAPAATGRSRISRLGSAAAASSPASRQPEDALRSASGRVDPELIAALETAAGNIRAVAEARLADDREVVLEQGQSVALREVPVGAAAIYAPGGAAACASTVLMGCIPAKVAVERVAVATPPGSGGERVPDVILAAAAIAGADEVYAIGGAQAIAALAIGTERIAPVDVVAGPGNRFVQEAKRQLVGEVGIDGIAGPSGLMVIAGDTANADWIGLDLCAQAEHGPDGLLVAAAVGP